MFNNSAGKNNYEEGPVLANLYIILLQDSLKSLICFLKKEKYKSLTYWRKWLINREKHCYFIAQTPLRWMNLKIQS